MNMFVVESKNVNETNTQNNVNHQTASLDNQTTTIGNINSISCILTNANETNNKINNELVNNINTNTNDAVNTNTEPNTNAIINKHVVDNTNAMFNGLCEIETYRCADLFDLTETRFVYDSFGENEKDICDVDTNANKIFPGNSGTPVINDRLCGILTTSDLTRLCDVIPVKYVLDFIRNIE